MASVEELLEKSLNELLEAELKKFQWHLKNDYKCITRTEMEKADILDTVDKMVARFRPEEAVKITVKILRKMNQNNLAEQLENNYQQVTFTNIVHWTRNDFLQYSNHLTLDPNTVNEGLHLSKRNRVITGTNTDQPYPDHPERFDGFLQVLCRESVSDRRCYWEIEWSGEYGPYISVSYKSISRKGLGNECRLGYNNQSWSLFCTPSRYSFWHNNIVTDLTVKPISRRIGVYVDHSAGTLSFYSVSGDTMILIHTVQTTFTQPLYPGFSVNEGSSLRLCY